MTNKGNLAGVNAKRRVARMATSPGVVDLPRLPGEPEPLGDVNGGCRWLHGPAVERMFCGAPVVGIGCSWCLHHRNRVWATVSRAQAERELRKAHLAEVA